MLELNLSNNHILAKSEDKSYLIDLSVDKSFAIDNSSSIKIDDYIFPLINDIYNYSPNDVDTFYGEHISGVIGMDILKKFGLLTINKLNNSIVFGTSNFTQFDTKHILSMKNNRIVVSINSYLNNAFIDISSSRAVINPLFAFNIAKKSSTQIYTRYGWQNVDIKDCVIKVEDKEISPALLMNEELLDKLPYKASIPINAIFDEFFVIDFKKNIIFFK